MAYADDCVVRDPSMLVSVDPRKLSYSATFGFRRQEPAVSTVRKFVREYMRGSAQDKMDFVTAYLASWPLLVLRVIEAIKDVFGQWRRTHPPPPPHPTHTNHHSIEPETP